MINIRKTLQIYIFSYLFFLFTSGLFYFLLSPYLAITKKVIYINTIAWFFEALILLFTTMVLLLLTRRKYLAFFITFLLYIIFLIINVIKIRYLATPLYPIDFSQLGDLFKTWELFKIFLPALIIMVIIIAAILRIGYKKERVINGNIFLINLLVATVLLTGVLFYRENIEVELRSLGIYHKKNANLPRRGLKYGYLTNFVQAGLFTSQSKQPAHYGFAQIQKIVQKYDLNTPIERDDEHQKPDNIIVLLIESFTDPADFGWQFSTNPVATFHALKESFPSGHIYSPVFGGKSINAEFELMTGMSNRFTPIESMPYQEFVKRNIPSLPRTFKQANYTTNTIQVIKFKGFGYGKIYEYLGVDNKISLADKEKYALDPTGKFTSSEEIAKEIIALTNNQKSSFVFSFPNSSHSPWLIDDYPDSNIFLQNGSDARLDHEISAYANAINHTDVILKNLIKHFRHSPEKTIIITMGDHQPGLHGYNRNYSYDQRYSDYINMILKNYKVPISVWSNYTDFGARKIHMSMNLLPSYILDLADIQLKGFMKFNNIIRNRMNIVTHIIQREDGIFSQDFPTEYKDLINDYEMLQYDLLFGENYLTRLID